MLADPSFLEAELVHQLDELHVALDRERRVLVDGVEGRDERAEAQAGRRHGGLLGSGTPEDSC
jgi:hypothetical protein